ncbi:MAG TPA: pseudouridine synthase [Spirochaetales bacterium]|nr:pseudouridine synthase [Spirochaetales bacterium]
MSHGVMKPFDEIFEPCILGQDKDFYFVFKPAGIDSVPIESAATSSKKPSASIDARAPRHDLVTWLAEQKPGIAPLPSEIPSSLGLLAHRYERELGLVSRLDNPTSGLVLFARTFDSFVAFVRAQQEDKVVKRYRLAALPAAIPSSCESGSSAFVPGSMPAIFLPERDFLENALQVAESTGSPGDQFPKFAVSSRFRSYGRRGAQVACILPELAPKTKKRITKEVYTTELLPRGLFRQFHALELDAQIHSGFRHQIRVHLAWAGFPIIGDSVYCSSLEQVQQDRESTMTERLLLESYEVCIAPHRAPRSPWPDGFYYSIYD